MSAKILLVNPPIYDFAAYDFWLKPYGLLTVAGFLQRKADLFLFDYLDRSSRFMPDDDKHGCEKWGRGRFYCERTAKPACFSRIPRHYRRFGLPRKFFRELLIEKGPFDFALIQTVMTYWYPGVRETIEDIRRFCPGTKIVIGGVYATLCPEHAQKLGADLVVQGANLQPLWKFLEIAPDRKEPPFWQGYENLQVGVIKLSDGCPFKCTYCSVPKVHPEFTPRPLERCLAELDLLCARGVKNIAFYDDALLFEADKVLKPFLHEVLKRDLDVNLHTPNGLTARFLTKSLAELMVKAGFKSFYLGFESCSAQWQDRTGGKVYAHEIADAMGNLLAAGADPAQITAYLIIGHPHGQLEDLQASMHFVHELGIRIMLSEFSPIPGTPDGEACRRWINMDEPLWHNNTVFPIVFPGKEKVDRLKGLCQQLNQARKTALPPRVSSLRLPKR